MEVIPRKAKILAIVCVMVVVLYFIVFSLGQINNSQSSVDFGEKMSNTGYQSERQYNKKTENRDTFTSLNDINVLSNSAVDLEDKANSFSNALKSKNSKPTIDFVRVSEDTSTQKPRGRYNFLDLNCVSTLPEQLVGAIEDMPILIPESLSFPPEVLACLYHRYVTTKQTGCVEPKLFGNANNKGGHICVDDGILQKNNCEAHIFSRAVDERYKSQLKTQYGCKVRTVEDNNDNLFLESFPSTKSFLLLTFWKWFESLSKSKNKIDLLVLELKTDDDIYAMNELLLAKDVMSRIQQISLRVHLPLTSASSLHYEQRLLILKKLFDMNFRIFHFNLDWPCAPENIQKSKFLSCYSVYMMRPRRKEPVILSLPSEESLRSMDNVERHNIFQRFVSSNQVLCRQNIRVGNVLSGGWNVCHDPVYRPSYPCLVYSFGINNDWTFDEDTAATYGCEVHSFDPSIHRKSYRYSDKVHFHNLGLDGKKNITSKGWELRTLDSIMSMLGHSDRVIDILKIDVEGSEIPALQQMFASGTLGKVRQLMLEYHGNGNLDMILVAKKLHDLGFRIHWTSMNLACVLPVDDKNGFSGFSTVCFEVYYIHLPSNRVDSKR